MQLRHVKYQMISQGKIGVFDGFMRECLSLERSYLAKAVITAHPDAFFIEVSMNMNVYLYISVHIVYVLVLWCTCVRARIDIEWCVCVCVCVC